MSVRVSSDETGAQQRPCRKHHGVRCMAPGCCNPLSRQYNVKKRLCTTHMKVGAQQPTAPGDAAAAGRTLMCAAVSTAAAAAATQAEAVQRRGYGEQMFRFCQQCGKLELLARFEGTKRCAAAECAADAAASHGWLINHSSHLNTQELRLRAAAQACKRALAQRTALGRRRRGAADSWIARRQQHATEPRPLAAAA